MKSNILRIYPFLRQFNIITTFIFLNILFILSVVSTKNVIDSIVFFLNFPTMIFWVIGFSFILFCYPLISKLETVMENEILRLDSNRRKHIIYSIFQYLKMILIFMLILTIVILINSILFNRNFSLIILSDSFLDVSYQGESILYVLLILTFLVFSYLLFLSLIVIISQKLFKVTILKIVPVAVINLILIVSHTFHSAGLNIFLKHLFYIQTNWVSGIRNLSYDLLILVFGWLSINLLLLMISFINELHILKFKSLLKRFNIIFNFKYKIIVIFVVLISIISSYLLTLSWNEPDLIFIPLLWVKRENVIIMSIHFLIPFFTLWIVTKINLHFYENFALYEIIRSNQISVLIRQYIFCIIAILFIYFIVFLTYSLLSIIGIYSQSLMIIFTNCIKVFINLSAIYLIFDLILNTTNQVRIAYFISSILIIFTSFNDNGYTLFSLVCCVFVVYLRLNEFNVKKIKEEIK